MRSSVALGMAILISTGCGMNDFRRVEELKTFRILGAVATDPEVAAGGSTTVRLYVSDINGGGRTITGSTEICIDPGVAFGAPVQCDHDPTKVTGSYSIDTAGDADLGSSNQYTGLATQAVTVNVPAQIFTGRNARDRNNGVSMLVIFRFDVDGRSLTAFRRVTATERTQKNTNPTIQEVRLNGGAINGKPAKDGALTIATSGPETYPVVNIDGSTEDRRENLEAAWYVSKGRLDRPKADVSETVTYKDEPPSEAMVIVVIVRDERGGTAIERRVL